MLSVDPTAKDLGCQDASKGADAAKQIIKDLVTQHPEVNLIYSEAANLTVGTMAGLAEVGRGKMEDGKPLTEIVASVGLRRDGVQAGVRSEQLAEVLDGFAADRDRPRPH